ncbi:hypothetical protein K402DRAFT_113796 [Aulographum hederae CBS 113979]|uniref:Uncharacterized protein n=1 Tax=Aulographum hederae CBS 113979 TaxID=1176131 RepID=A0A6G1GWF8_9PEZI|nr:hypothetical protein K402DRAFT_113796 [Aulographum hederae CBS 113979]
MGGGSKVHPAKPQRVSFHLPKANSSRWLAGCCSAVPCLTTRTCIPLPHGCRNQSACYKPITRISNHPYLFVVSLHQLYRSLLIGLFLTPCMVEIKKSKAWSLHGRRRTNANSDVEKRLPRPILGPSPLLIFDFL